jgi:hypothetical protein
MSNQPPSPAVETVSGHGELVPAHMGFFIPEGDVFAILIVLGLMIGAPFVLLKMGTRRLKRRPR